MTADPSKILFYTGYNAYKNTGVKSATVTVSGTVAAGAVADYETSITLDEVPTYFTILVKTTSALTSDTARWQPLPSANYYVVPASGPASSLGVLLVLAINGTTLTFRAWTLNPFGSTLTWTTTNIEFKYVPYTLAN